MSPRRVLLAAFLVLSLGAASPAATKSDHTQKLLGVYGNWRAFSFRENGQPVCFMALTNNPPRPKKHAKNNSVRGAGHLMITHRPGDNSKDVVSYSPGYIFKADSAALVHIGKGKFDLFTTRDTAWTRDAVSDHRLAAAIRANTSMTVTGTPIASGKAKKAKPNIDTIDLTGSAKAYQAIGKACGYAEDSGASSAPAKTKKKHKKTKKSS